MRLLTLLMFLACKEPAIDGPLDAPPAEGVAAGLTIRGTAVETIDLPDGRKAFISEAIFLGNDISKSTGIVTLHLQGIVATPGTEAEFYWTTMPGATFDPANYIGSFATIVGSPTSFADVPLEINDFEADGKKYTARTTLSGLPYYSVTMVVKTGTITIDEYTLTAAP
jgi:hypothetical protein